MNIKTLKDIYDKSKMSYISDEAEQVVDELRDAVKEHLKQLQQDIHNDNFTFNWERDYAIGKIEFIKHFFNLEDEY